jgi:hypothetical protein
MLRQCQSKAATPQQAALEAVKWLERLEQGEMSGVVGRDLEVELTPVQIEQHIRNMVILQDSITKLILKILRLHMKMLKDPREWEEYHRQYREARKSWSVIPYEEIIKRIKQLSKRHNLRLWVW